VLTAATDTPTQRAESAEIVRVNYNMPDCHAMRPRGALPLLWSNWIAVDDVTYTGDNLPAG
jgi:hypothetical protein